MEGARRLAYDGSLADSGLPVTSQIYSRTCPVHSPLSLYSSDYARMLELSGGYHSEGMIPPSHSSKSVPLYAGNISQRTASSTKHLNSSQSPSRIRQGAPHFPTIMAENVEHERGYDCCGPPRRIEGAVNRSCHGEQMAKFHRSAGAQEPENFHDPSYFAVMAEHHWALENEGNDNAATGLVEIPNQCHGSGANKSSAFAAVRSFNPSISAIGEEGGQRSIVETNEEIGNLEAVQISHEHQPDVVKDQRRCDDFDGQTGFQSSGQRSLEESKSTGLSGPRHRLQDADICIETSK